MREAANQHNIFISIRIYRPAANCGRFRSWGLCTRARACIKFKRHQSFARARARQTMTCRVETLTMRRTDQLIAQSIQKPVGKGFERQTQMRAPVHKTPNSVRRMPDDEVEVFGAVPVGNYKAAGLFWSHGIGRANDRATGGQP